MKTGNYKAFLFYEEKDFVVERSIINCQRILGPLKIYVEWSGKIDYKIPYPFTYRSLTENAPKISDKLFKGYFCPYEFRDFHHPLKGILGYWDDAEFRPPVLSLSIDSEYEVCYRNVNLKLLLDRVKFLKRDLCEYSSC